MIRSLALISSITLLGVGCASSRSGATRNDPPKQQSRIDYIELDERGKFGARSVVTLSPPSGDTVPVYTLRNLPEGFYVASDLRNVKAEPDFPTPQAPHRVIGLISGLGSMLSQQSQAEVAAQLTESVKAHGGNALVFSGAEAQVLAVSSAPAAYPAAAEAWPRLDAAFAMDKYVPGETLPIALDAVTPTQVKLKRRECIAVAVALEPTANFAGRRGTWHLATPGSAPGADRVLVQGQWGGSSRERTFRSVVTCASKPTTVPLTLSSAEGGPIGTGPAKLRVYRLRPADATVAAECARCSARLRNMASSTKSDMSKCLPPSMTPDICD